MFKNQEAFFILLKGIKAKHKPNALLQMIKKWDFAVLQSKICSIVILGQNLSKPFTVLRQILITYICRNQRYWHKLNWIECKSGHCDLQVVHIHWYLKIELFLYHIIGKKNIFIAEYNSTMGPKAIFSSIVPMVL